MYTTQIVTTTREIYRYVHSIYVRMYLCMCEYCIIVTVHACTVLLYICTYMQHQYFVVQYVH